MLISSGRHGRRCGLIASLVPQEYPQDVDPSSGEDGLGVVCAFGAFAVAEPQGFGAEPDPGQRRVAIKCWAVKPPKLWTIAS